MALGAGAAGLAAAALAVIVAVSHIEVLAVTARDGGSEGALQFSPG